MTITNPPQATEASKGDTPDSIQYFLTPLTFTNGGTIINSDDHESSSSTTNSQLQEQEPTVSTSSSQDVDPNRTITVSNVQVAPMVFNSGALVTINGRKCILKVDPKTNKVEAYPIPPKEPVRPRGRPRKTATTQKIEDCNDSKDHAHEYKFDQIDVRSSDEQADATLGLADKDGCKRSLRCRKKPKVLTEDYEVVGSDVDVDTASPQEDDNAKKTKRTNRMLNYIHSLGIPGTKRGRGRPRLRPLSPPEEFKSSFLLINTQNGSFIMAPESCSDASLQAVVTAATVKDGPPVVAVDTASHEGAGSYTVDVVTGTWDGKGAEKFSDEPYEEAMSHQVPIKTQQATSDELYQSILGFDDESLADDSSYAGHNLDQDELLKCAQDPVQSDGLAIDHTVFIEDQIPKVSVAALNHTETKKICLRVKSEKSDGRTGAVWNSSSAKSLAPLGLKSSGLELQELVCECCGTQAMYEAALRAHIKEHHRDISFPCKCCAYICLREEKLDEHYRTFHPKCICSQCNFKTNHGYILRRHLQRHDPVGNVCCVCGKNYKDQYILKMHFKMVHMPAATVFRCSVCGQTFTRKAHLTRHLRIHEDVRPFKCPDCDYRGCEKSDVTKHQLIHSQPQLTCDVCHKMFRHDKNLQLHKKRHRGQRDFKCGVCNYYSYTPTDIRKHIARKHGGGKDVKHGVPAVLCKSCNLLYQPNDYKTHLTYCSGTTPESDEGPVDCVALTDEDEEQLINMENQMMIDDGLTYIISTPQQGHHDLDHMDNFEDHLNEKHDITVSLDHMIEPHELLHHDDDYVHNDDSSAASFIAQHVEVIPRGGLESLDEQC